MPEYTTTAAVAEAAGVSVRSVERNCQHEPGEEPKLRGAHKSGRDWWVPVEYAEPGAYRAAVGAPGRKAKE